MVEPVLEIIEPNETKGNAPLYFNGTNLLKIIGDAVNKLSLSNEDEYILFAKLGDMLFISKKQKGDNKFGFHARNRNQKKATWYITSKELASKIELHKGYYDLGEKVEQAGRTWYKLVRL